MKIGDELENINNGYNRTLEDVCDTVANGRGNYREVVELLNHSHVDNTAGEIVVDSNYANDKIYGALDTKDQVKDLGSTFLRYLENGWKEVSSTNYEAGISSGERKVQELNDRLLPDDAWDRIRDKAKGKEKSVKVNEAAMSAGLLGTTTGWQTGSRTIGLPSALLTAGTILRQGKLQGERDKLEKEAVRGWKNGYGNYRVTIS